MQLIRDVTSLHKIGPCVAIIGNFDGIHLAHQALIKQLLQVAQQTHLPSVVITFEPHPQEYFSKSKPPARLTRLREKWQVLQSFPIDYLVCLRFNKALAQMSAHDFISELLVNNLHVRHLLVGHDFHFGYQRQGNVDLLRHYARQYNYQVTCLAAICADSQRISSSQIRQALSQGDLAQAQQLLGRPFTMQGHVAYGQQRGRQLGFPTANIHIHRKTAPLKGVYYVKVHGLGPKPIFGVANIGERPTIEGNGRTILEVYLLDFNSMIYGQLLTVEPLTKIRDEMKFNSLDALKNQIAQDVAQCRALRV